MHLRSLHKFTCMQFSRYDIDWIFISHIRRKAFFSSYITGKTSYYNSSSRLIRVSIGLIDYLLAPPCFRQGSLSNACIYVQQTCVCCFLFWSGGHLLSHIVSNAVPSAAWVLTVVFGMGTGVSPKRIATRSRVLNEYKIYRRTNLVRTSFRGT